MSSGGGWLFFGSYAGCPGFEFLPTFQVRATTPSLETANSFAIFIAGLEEHFVVSNVAADSRRGAGAALAHELRNLLAYFFGANSSRTPRPLSTIRC